MDQLIGIRDLEQQLIVAMDSADEGCSIQLRFRVAELDLWLDMLDRALDAFAPSVRQLGLRGHGARGPFGWEPVGEAERLSRQKSASGRTDLMCESWRIRGS